jgi:hypothetical protein
VVPAVSMYIYDAYPPTMTSLYCMPMGGQLAITWMLKCRKCSFIVASVRLSLPWACEYWEGRLQAPVLDSFDELCDALRGTSGSQLPHLC